MTQQGNVVHLDLSHRSTAAQARSTVLKHLTEADWRLILEAGELMSFVHGEIMLREGQTNDSLYFIDDGQVRVVRGDATRSVELARLDVGSVFGEMSILDGATASASIIAESLEVDVVRIDRAELERVMTDNPGLGLRFYRSIAETLSMRLRDTNKIVRILQ
jgi:CRP/FNR family cyclic AMP-dependent transcriptional regulator